MIKLCIEDYAIFLIDEYNIEQLCTLEFKRAFVYKRKSVEFIVDLINDIENQPVKKHIFIVKDAIKLFKEIKANYKSIKAGGGLVFNEKGEVLFIMRNKKWDLPKGKSEKGETKRETAIRETEEETGVTIEECQNLITKTYHFYKRNQVSIIKTTFWYRMQSNSKYPFHPQEDEGIEKVEWKTISEIPDIIKNTYSSVRDVIHLQLATSN